MVVVGVEELLELLLALFFSCFHTMIATTAANTRKVNTQITLSQHNTRAADKRES